MTDGLFLWVMHRFAEVFEELRAAAESLDERAVGNELAPVLPADELVGLLPRLRAAIVGLAKRLEA